MRGLALCIAAISLTGDGFASTQQYADASSAAAAFRGVSQSLAEGKHPGLPDEWRIETPDGEFTISTSPLQRFLKASPEPETAEAQEWLDHLAKQLESYDAGNQRDDTSARDRMRSILSQPEFAGSGPPGALKRLQQRVSNWIGNLFRDLFQSLGRHPTGAQIVFWAALLGAIGWLIWWLVRRGRMDIGLHLSGGEHSILKRTWEDWIGAAHNAARQRDFRAAVQCAYWAGVSRLQSTGALPDDRTRTPREYVRALGSDLGQPFRALVQMMEKCWFACLPATEQDFGTCLRLLGELGCKAD